MTTRFGKESDPTQVLEIQSSHVPCLLCHDLKKGSLKNALFLGLYHQESFYQKLLVLPIVLGLFANAGYVYFL